MVEHVTVEPRMAEAIPYPGHIDVAGTKPA